MRIKWFYTYTLYGTLLYIIDAIYDKVDAIYSKDRKSDNCYYSTKIRFLRKYRISPHLESNMLIKKRVVILVQDVRNLILCTSVDPLFK